MQQYLAKLTFSISFGNSDKPVQFDEQVRVIVSPSMEDAFFKARAIGRREEETFYDASEKPVTWKFIDVAEIYPLDVINDGEQLYSSTHTTSDAPSYISYIRRKSMEIQAKTLTFA